MRFCRIATVVTFAIFISSAAFAQGKNTDPPAAAAAKAATPQVSAELATKIAKQQRDMNAFALQVVRMQQQQQNELNDLLAQAQKQCGDPKNQVFDPEKLSCAAVTKPAPAPAAPAPGDPPKK